MRKICFPTKYLVCETKSVLQNVVNGVLEVSY